MIASISKVKLFKACRRAYFFKHIEKLVPVEKAEALETGLRYHDYIEGLYKGEEITGFSKEAAMAKAYEKYILPKIPKVTPELWFSEVISGHTLTGRIDGITPDGCVVEHKTTSADISPNGEYEYSLMWDEQIPAYMAAKKTNKIKYTVCRKPTIRLKKDETEEEFFARMVAWYDEDTESKIRTFDVYRDQEEIEQFMRDFVGICEEMESAEATKKLYRNTCHCSAWGRRCEYSSICLNYDPNSVYVEFEKKN